MNLSLFELPRVFSYEPDSDGRGPRIEVDFLVARCCDGFEVFAVTLTNQRLIVRCCLAGSMLEDDMLEFEVHYHGGVDAKPVAAMDMSHDVAHLVLVSEDADVRVVPLMELMYLHSLQSASRLTEVLRSTRIQREPKAASAAAQELSSGVQFPAWAATGIVVGEMITDFFGGSGGPVEKSVGMARFQVASRLASVSAAVCWSLELCALDDEGSTDLTTEHYLILGGLSGGLAILDLKEQKEVRTFSLAPIVWLQLCKSRSEDWLLIETTMEPKYWKLVLASGGSASPQSGVLWSITDGLALPPTANVHFELEALSFASQPLHLLVCQIRSVRPGWTFFLELQIRPKAVRKTSLECSRRSGRRTASTPHFHCSSLCHQFRRDRSRA